MKNALLTGDKRRGEGEGEGGKLVRIYLHTVDYTTFAEIHHRHKMTSRWYTRCESESRTNSPGGRIKRPEDGECRTLLLDQPVPRACLHHVKASVEGKLAHGVESEPHHHVVERDGGCPVAGNDILKNTDLRKNPC